MDAPDFFLATVQHVIGQPLSAAGYVLEDNPLHQTRGLFRYRKALDIERYAFLEFQTLYNPQSELSYFRITLLRNVTPDARAASPEQLERSLAHLLWHEYDLRVLSFDDHWWVYKFQQDLAPSLYDAGKLLFAYGIPWLEDMVI